MSDHKCFTHLPTPRILEDTGVRRVGVDEEGQQLRYNLLLNHMPNRLEGRGRGGRGGNIYKSEEITSIIAFIMTIAHIPTQA